MHIKLSSILDPIKAEAQHTQGAPDFQLKELSTTECTNVQTKLATQTCHEPLSPAAYVQNTCASV